jgi:hypothetical protein
MDPNSWQIETAVRTMLAGITQNSLSEAVASQNKVPVFQKHSSADT